ncbi:MAG: phenylalanine--tRNA ligase subunit alpha [Candidatus Omnitrophica bacterium]|jgi:phenylalanyl-tRNA synthetase alpha chain|nr:phenylalanine--tRNA ligase subunit alpha [Candidatus Omnitrophota bacterium]MDD3274469.1 phenylalanine--tRNA ligase subunit alpha [Candidatus Omnitrophota bacterium]MDD5077886.1 phenylalanine--tRNA ligase subunit alpha [Candidatus Omnitrophota bacterium]MDD5724661.1 phenylalanine--tRNA ligase subunit alpha [Candidatus Omnitrophota bacterium]
MDIDSLQAQVKNDLEKVSSPEALEEVRVKYLGRKGVVAELTGSIPGIPVQERGEFGRKVNAFKSGLHELFAKKEESLKDGEALRGENIIDIGMPGIAQQVGTLHPLTRITDEICSVFSRMGFSVAEGPEVETEYNNFTGLNIPLEHPSREAFDTFYLKDYDKKLLRSHTSPAQVRIMQEKKPPLAVVVPGRVYRPDAVDASHSFMFHQIEGLMVGEGIKFSDLKGVLETFAKAIFGEGIKMRFRPHFFPFTEPSAEVDISCIICGGKGCSVCGRKGWLEILGSGMVHPNVFKHVAIDADKYSGFAFGMGVERIAMLKYGINDIRLFFENDLRFLRQF